MGGSTAELYVENLIGVFYVKLDLAKLAIDYASQNA